MIFSSQRDWWFAPISSNQCSLPWSSYLSMWWHRLHIWRQSSAQDRWSSSAGYLDARRQSHLLVEKYQIPSRDPRRSLACSNIAVICRQCGTDVLHRKRNTQFPVKQYQTCNWKVECSLEGRLTLGLRIAALDPANLWMGFMSNADMLPNCFTSYKWNASSIQLSKTILTAWTVCNLVDAQNCLIKEGPSIWLVATKCIDVVEVLLWESCVDQHSKSLVDQ